MHADELRKIRDATSGWFKGNARVRIKECLTELFKDLNNARSLEGEAQQSELRRFMNYWTEKRQHAVAMGARGYGDAEWAAAAACETWVQATATSEGPPLAEVENLVRELLSR